MAVYFRGCCCHAFNKKTFSLNSVNAIAPLYSRWLSTSRPEEVTQKPEKDPAPLFLKAEVQEILKKVTGFDLDKIFRERTVPDLKTPEVKLLTDKQLQEFHEEAVEHGREKMQMPPVLKMWDETSRVLSEDPEIADFDTHKYVFTDITYGVPYKERIVVVRETDGTLRFATRKEKDRLVQVYLPRAGKKLKVPAMFAEDTLEGILMAGRYEYVLDRACVQFEPDDPEYIRVTHRTYEHIAERRQYDVLRSTRHFGVMTFYFTLNKKIDGLLADMIQNDLLSDAADVVRLYHILHPSCQSAQHVTDKTKKDPEQLIKLYLQYDSQHSGLVELALQSYNESIKTPAQTSQ